MISRYLFPEDNDYVHAAQHIQYAATSYVGHPARLRIIAKRSNKEDK